MLDKSLKNYLNNNLDNPIYKYKKNYINIKQIRIK